MNLSHADDKEAELQAVEHQRNIRRFYAWGSAKPLRPNFPLTATELTYP